MNQKGFSLIELMVVVAIIGILSAVAVPQFQKFQRKAKQSEARANLAAAYTAQKVFAVETGSFYSNLWAIGYEPEGDMKYIVGFSGATPLGANLPGYTASPYTHSQYEHTSLMCSTTYAGGISSNCRFSGTSLSMNISGLAVAPTATTFTMIAAADTLTLGGSVDDHWTINQRKELINAQNGAL